MTQETNTVNRPLPTRLASAAAAAAAVLVLGACTPATSTEDAAAFHACLDAPSLQFASIATTADALSCGPDEVPVSWLAAAPLDSAAPTFAATSSSSAGSKGETGATGVDGEDGATGAAGANGQDGEPGTDGATGAAGANGQDGTNGTDGATGATGAAGANGQDGTDGATGATGAAGANGQDGADGAAGAAGANGQDGAAGIPGSDGNGIHNGTGAPGNSLGIDGDFYLDTTAFTVYGPKVSGSWSGGSQSLIGPQGPIGPQGIQGFQGNQGFQGIQGSTGAVGLQGLVGPVGATGPAGPAGPAGSPGPAPVFTGALSFVDAADTSGFITVSGGNTIVSGISDAEIAMPREGSLSGLNVAVTPRDGTVTLTLWVNGVTSGLACTVPDRQPTCASAGPPVRIEPGDNVGLRYAATGPEPVKNLRHSMSFGGS